MARLGLFMILSLLSLTNGNIIETKAGPLLLEVFYEALDINFKTFLTKQLMPTENLLGKYLKINLFPYGNTVAVPQGDKWGFICSQGPKGCAANMEHTCIIENMEDSHAELAMISCMVSDGSDIAFCAQDVGMVDMVLQDIRHCCESDYGNRFQYQMGLATHKYSFTTYPSIVIDKNNFVDDEGMMNLEQILCSRYLADTKECENLQ